MVIDRALNASAIWSGAVSGARVHHDDLPARVLLTGDGLQDLRQVLTLVLGADHNGDMHLSSCLAKLSPSLASG